MFSDTATIEIRAGKGGNGRSSFRHEKYRAMGGPDGGDGGHGGNVVFRVDHNANTLSSYRTARLISAEDGLVGGGNQSRGHAGADVIINVPEGTQVWCDDELLADLTVNGQEAVLAKGGRGGFGNAHFVSSVRQAPRTAELGEPGESRKLRLELKMVADVGLVGLPNAGKSTLLSVVTNAKPAIADYAFTTLIPNLGVVEHRDFAFLMADIPGLIEGASEGKGLGDEFLRHVERTAVLFHMIDAASDDVVRDYKVIQKELASYVVDLSTRPQLVVITKAETVEPTTLEAARKALKKHTKQDVYVISAQAHQGLEPLLDAAVPVVKAARDEHARLQAEKDAVVITDIAMPDMWHIEIEEDDTYRVIGERIQGFALRTNFESDEGVERLRDIMRKTGVARGLRRQGCKPGDKVVIGESTFEWL